MYGRPAIILIFLGAAAVVIPKSDARRLRGPNVCYHYDVGRYCCNGFTEVNGFCIREVHDEKSSKPESNEVEISAPLSSRIRFAPKPSNEKVASLTKVDENGRPVEVLYSHSAVESIVYPGTSNHQNEEPYKPNLPSQQDNYYKPIDMEEIRRKLQKDQSSTTEQPTTKPKLRFQKPPTSVREWDWERNQWKDEVDDTNVYNQVAYGRYNDNFFKAVKISGASETSSSWPTANNQAAEFRAREIISIPYNRRPNTEKTTSTTPSPAFVSIDSAENRIYFQSVPHTEDKTAGSASAQSPSGGAAQTACPEGYTSVRSQSGSVFCYPISGLTSEPEKPQIERAPIRGDGAERYNCPSGHYFRSSEYGDACVPNGWEPCSDSPTCSHSNQPIVNPVTIVECQNNLGQQLPCQAPQQAPTSGCFSGGCGEEVPSQSGCLNGGCIDSPIECGSAGCYEASPDFSPPVEVSGCVGNSCNEAAACTDGGTCGFSKNDKGHCKNGATLAQNGICICPPGFIGETCEEDVDECTLEGDRRGPCEHECLNTVGSYKCFCPAGSVLAADGTSCVLIACPKCMHGGYCDQRTNKCVCPSGFTGDICETDINECLTPGICSHQCRNTFGSYRCLCRQGYTLLKDGQTCEDYRCRPKCVNGGVCVQNRCICPEGFTGIICQFDQKMR